MPTTQKNTHAQTIEHFWLQGKSAGEIHRLTSIARSTIYYNISKLKKTRSTAHKKRSGRPTKITPECSRSIGQIVRKNPTISLRTLTTKLFKKGTRVSYSTLSRHLAKHGFEKSLPLATPMLTLAHKEKRVEWARKHLNDNWNRTLFSDETAFRLFRNTVQVWYKGQRPVRRIPKDRTKINAWGGFCTKGKTSLYCFREDMTGLIYVDILKKHVSEIRGMLRNNWRFQQDNDPKHTSGVAKEYLQNNFPSVIDWPSNSPDLNPIENLWSIVKRNVEIRQPRNIRELEKFMMEEWEEIPQRLLNNLVRSMKERCKLIIENNGERIPY
jgi:transposase